MLRILRKRWSYTTIFSHPTHTVVNQSAKVLNNLSVHHSCNVSWVVLREKGCLHRKQALLQLLKNS